MQERTTRVMRAAAVAGLIAVAAAAAMRETASMQQPTILRLAGTPHPDLQGVWQAMREVDYDLEGHAAEAAVALRPGVPNGQPVPAAPVLALGALGGVPPSAGVVVGGVIPYRPEALAQRDENRAEALARDPLVKCLLPGVPRATYLPFPFQITQGDDKILIAYGFSNAGRTIHLDEVDPPGVVSWMGHSVGRWEGDTLVVEVTELMDQTWFDRAGNYHQRRAARRRALHPHHAVSPAVRGDRPRPGGLHRAVGNLAPALPAHGRAPARARGTAASRWSRNSSTATSGGSSSSAAGRATTAAAAAPW